MTRYGHSESCGICHTSGVCRHQLARGAALLAEAQAAMAAQEAKPVPMTTPWTAPGLTPEERARAVLTGVYDMRWLDEDYAKITAAIRAAVAAETERCARVAEDLSADRYRAAGNCAPTLPIYDGADILRARAREAENIAEEIRAIRVPTSGAAAGGES